MEKQKSLVEIMTPMVETYNELHFKVLAKMEAAKNKDKSGICMMANYKNVMPYVALRVMVGELLQLMPTYQYLRKEVIESIITEIIYKSIEGDIRIDEIGEIIDRWSPAKTEKEIYEEHK